MIYIWVTLVFLVFIAATYWTHMSPYSQLFGNFPYRVKTVDKVIALTFDDGPNDPHTTDLLNYLKTENIRATFFLVGACVEKYPATTQRIASDGHTIGNHSYSHKFLEYLKHPHFKDEIEKTQTIIKQTTGKTPALFRPPWLYRQPALFHTINTKGMSIISGTFCHPLEVKQIPADKIANKVITNAKSGSIIIFHDGHDSKGGDRSQTIDAVKIVIKSLKAQDYSFVTVDELLQIKPYLD